MSCLCGVKCTSSAAGEFAIDVHEVREVLSFFIFGRVSSLFGRV
jgi:hypothetical protein